LFDPFTLTAIAFTFLLAGIVKGVVGMGLPAVSLGLLTILLDLTSAMALMLVPSLVTNIWQATVGGYGKGILTRLWLFYVLAFGAVWIGGHALVIVDLAILSALLGILLVLYGASGLANYGITIEARREGWIGPSLGFVNGVFTGMTGSFSFPGVLYLQALGLKRDELIQAMGILFALSTLGVAVALQSNALLTVELGMVSSVGLVPAVLGMYFGQRIRKRLSEETFRRVFLGALVLMGLYIGASASFKYFS
tara:strand:+ start:24236 stop:24991 length:756 start_codon:yes stop_codon:yes gene_type:complete